MNGERAKVLVVDDNPKNLQVVGSILYENGYEPIATTSGAQALEILQEIETDLVLLDVMMPEMDGFEVCRRIKKKRKLKDLPIIFLTAKTETEDLLQGFEAGAVDYIHKPFKALELLARLKVHLELKRAREKITTLRGLLPICASCKKIRDDEGYWEKIENYIQAHTDAEFTHGICPECAKKLYADFLGEDFDFKKNATKE